MVLARVLAIGSLPSDSPDISLRKKTAVLLSLVLLPCATLCALLFYASGQRHQAIGPAMFILFVSLGGLPHLAVTRRVRGVATAVVSSMAVCPMSVQLAAGGILPSNAVANWSMVVAPLAALFFGWRTRDAGCVLASIVLVFGLSVAGEVADLYSPPDDAPSRTWRVLLTTTNVLGPSVASVVALSFYVRRERQAREKLQDQICIVRKTLDVTERLVGCLARYDTARAADLVKSAAADGLPADLRGSLQSLVSNLDVFRPFLPDTVLDPDRSEAEDVVTPRVSGAPPGVGEAPDGVAICFTDVESSTVLWEVEQQAMFESLKIHNRVLRRLLVDCGGYEVKTIGDAFMTVFSDPVSCCRFGVRAQGELLRQDWPPELCRHELCRHVSDRNERPLWGGLRVRIGGHHGPVRVEGNPVTGRHDYFGPPVNVAARVEQHIKHGGLTAFTGTLLEAAGDATNNLGVVRAFLGDLRLKGVSASVPVWVVLEEGMSGRLEVLSSSQEARRPTPPPRNPLASSCGSRDSSGAATLRPHGLRTRTRDAVVTTVAARMAGDGGDPDVQDTLPALEVLVDVAQGSVSFTLSSLFLATWNAGPLCANHIVQGAHFVERVHVQGLKVHVGATTGPATVGTVAASRRMFANVVGAVVEVALALSTEAQLDGEFGLASGPIANFLSSTQPHTSRHQVWLADAGSAELLVWCVRFAGTQDSVWTEHAFDRQKHDQLDELFIQLATAEDVGGTIRKVVMQGDLSDEQLRMVEAMERDSAVRVRRVHRSLLRKLENNAA